METAKKASNALRGLERQKEFLSSVESGTQKFDSFFITEKVMESMRDSGYRDIRRALNDLIDNSEQAGASKIAVVTTSDRDQPKSKEKITNIAVIDNGHGMYPEMLEIAVKWGGTDRHNERDGLGRFGFGLPTASISVTRVYDVYSKVKGGDWHRVTVDLNIIAQEAMTSGGNIVNTPKCENAQLPAFLKEYIKSTWKLEDLTSGTIVLLKNPDRIRRYSVPQIFQAKMLQNIGLTYRHFMPDVTFLVNEKKVEMIDPLFLNPNCIGYDAGNGLFAESIDDMVIRVKNTLVSGKTIEGDITLRFSITDPKFQRDNNFVLIKNRWNTMKDNNAYFIVCRAGRQIDVVKEPYYQSDDDNITLLTYDANWAIELDFEPALDELFGITTNKQQVDIDAYLWDLFKDHDIPSMIRSMRKRNDKIRVDNSVKQKTEEDVLESEVIMTETEKYDKLDIPDERQEEANEKLRQKAVEVATSENVDVETVVERMQEENERQRYKVEFTSLPGAPFYDVEQWGSQTRIRINTAHKFYTDIYSQQDPRGKTAIELLLFVLGKCEVESSGDKYLFYGNERYEWSRKLDLRLRMLDKRDPITEKEAALEHNL